MSSVIIFGGYGTFGSHVARALALAGTPVVIAGRDGARAAAFATTLGPGHCGLAADINDLDSCHSVLQGQTVAVNCAGPFSGIGPTLLAACLDVGCHYADIADERRYVDLVRAHDKRFRERGLAAVVGCSSLPGISGALALAARAESAVAPRHARVTLFVGNDNAKGGGAIRSVVELLGKPIKTPQGIVKGFRDGEVVLLPQPFGRRTVYNFQSPEYDLFPGLLGVRSVSVKIGLEMRLATRALSLLAGLGSRYGRRMALFLEWMGERVRGFGNSGGVVMTELFWADGTVRRAALLARQDGQRMAALPCAFVALALADGMAGARGALTVYELLGAMPLLEQLTSQGYTLEQSASA